jgi:hypothetical protein
MQNRIYPGAVIPVNDIDEFFCIDADGVATLMPLPPGVPLDEDLVEALLQHLKWDRDSRFSVEHNVKLNIYTKLRYEEAAEIQAKCANAVEQIQMEALWRQIKRKKEQACSKT